MIINKGQVRWSTEGPTQANGEIEFASLQLDVNPHDALELTVKIYAVSIGEFSRLKIQTGNNAGYNVHGADANNATISFSTPGSSITFMGFVDEQQQGDIGFSYAILASCECK